MMAVFWLGIVSSVLSFGVGCALAYAALFPRHASRVADFIDDVITALYEDDGEIQG